MSKEIIEAVKGAAQSFTYRGKLLSFSNPDFPLAIFADGYNPTDPDVDPTISQQSVASVESHFESANADAIEPIVDERESIITNTHAGVAKLQYNVHNVMIPAIKAMCKSYSEQFNISIQPDISVDVFNYASVHNDSDLLNHLSTSYMNAQIQPTYRTFILEPLSAEDIIELIANNNKHFEREFLTEWLLGLGAEKIVGVFTSLFNNEKAITLNALPFMTLGKAPLNTDEILVAYFLLAAYRDNPTDRIVGESVSIEEWEQALSHLHSGFGKVLLGAYANRNQMREQNVLVLKYDCVRPIQTQKVKVLLNGDVAEEWVINNPVDLVLGAAISNPQLITTDALTAQADKLSKVWLNTYPIIQQSALDRANLAKRQIVHQAFLDNAEALESLVVLDTIKPKLEQAMHKCSLNDYENHFLLFTKLVCEVCDSETIYQEYLSAIDEFSRVFPEATARELETQALITVIALYMARQVTIVDYTPDIDESAPAEPVEEETVETETESATDVENGVEDSTEPSETEEESEVDTKSVMEDLDNLDADTLDEDEEV